jgi:hypothetical protein
MILVAEVIDNELVARLVKILKRNILKQAAEIRSLLQYIGKLYRCYLVSTILLA